MVDDISEGCSKKVAEKEPVPTMRLQGNCTYCIKIAHKLRNEDDTKRAKRDENG